jgi:DNA-directed RNA polymerase specialized sigma24 family protein
MAERIIRLIGPDLQLFVFGAIARPAAEDALQEVLKAIALNLHKFTGGTVKEFWGWRYRIARNKLNDQFRKEYSDRVQTMGVCPKGVTWVRIRVVWLTGPSVVRGQ